MKMGVAEARNHLKWKPLSLRKIEAQHEMEIIGIQIHLD